MCNGRKRDSALRFEKRLKIARQSECQKVQINNAWQGLRYHRKSREKASLFWTSRLERFDQTRFCGLNRIQQPWSLSTLTHTFDRQENRKIEPEGNNFNLELRSQTINVDVNDWLEALKMLTAATLPFSLWHSVTPKYLLPMDLIGLGIVAFQWVAS